MKKLFEFIRKNKLILLIFFLLFIVLIYCHFNTFLGNDDLPYSFFRRLSQRITNLFQVLWDSLRYYKSTNGRFIVHFIVMALLIFGKNLWSILNPLIIVIMIYCIFKMVYSNKYDKKSQIIVCLLCSTLFLMMYKFKEVIYWVAGSVNYLWVCCFIIIYCYLYLKKDIFKYKKTNVLLLFILSTLHENSFVFFLIFIIVLNVKEYIKNKKISYLKYILPVLLGGGGDITIFWRNA